MEKSKVELQTLLLTSIHASIEAGFQIMDIYDTKIKVSIKRNLTPVTNADKLANETIIQRLEPFAIPFISEESSIAPFEERTQWDYCWLIDPLDGTKEFISHRTDFTVNIALIYKSIPIMGVIYAPAWDTLYFASEGMGSFRLDKASSLIKEHLIIDDIISASTKLPDITTDTYTYVVSRSHINMKTRRYLKKNKGEKVFISKGSSLKLCAIAEGSAHEYPRFGRTMEWDIAAGDAIIRNAGAKVRIEGSSDLLTYNKADLANPEFIASH
ncbi:MAG: 3'(2'),5'-bisphosphate nucleotidase CysQ [Bacteroidota bacterium]